MRQLKIYDRIPEENQRRCYMLFQDVRTALEQNLAGHVKKGQASAYVYAALDALADVTSSSSRARDDSAICDQLAAGN